MFTRRFFDRAGNQISEQVYIALSRNPSYKQVNLTEVTARFLGGFKRGFQVSTIWLGEDYGDGVGHDPVIFETMVFPLTGKRRISREVAARRATTLDEARSDHAELLKDAAGKLTHHPFRTSGVRYYTGTHQ